MSIRGTPRNLGDIRETRLTRSGEGHAELHPLKNVTFERVGEIRVLDYGQREQSTQEAHEHYTHHM